MTTHLCSVNPSEAPGARRSATRRLRKSSHTFFAALGWFCFSILPLFHVHAADARATVPPVLTKAVQVLQLTRDQAATAPRVELRGVVTYADSQWNIWFLQDETAGIYMDYPQSKPRLETGQQIRARGNADPGGFAPIIVGKDVVLEGRAPLPKARTFSLDQLAGGAQDCQRVEIEAIVEATYVKDGHLHLELHPVYHITAFLPGFTNRPAPSHLVDARVRLRGVWSSGFNNKAQQLPSYQLFIASLEDVTIMTPARPDPFTLPTQPTVNALGFINARRFGHRIKVAGAVTATEPGGIVYLQDSTGGLRIHTRDSSAFASGERIEVIGFPRVGSVSPRLEESVVRRVGRGVEPMAISIHSTNMFSEEWNSRLVTLEGELVETVPRGDHGELVLRAGTEFFTARLGGTNAIQGLNQFVPGCHLAVSGVGSVQADDQHRPTSLVLVLRSPRDIQVLRSAPWWTVGRLFSLLAATAFALLAWRLRGFKNETQLKEQFQRVFASSPLATTLHSVSDGRIMDVNAQFLSLLQFTREEVIGRTSLELGIWCDPKARDRLLTRMDQGIDVRDFEARFRGKGGHEHDILLSTQFVQLTTGKLAMVQADDITSRKRAEEALRSSEARFRTIFTSEPECVKVVKSDGILLEMNDAGLAMLEVDSLAEAKNRPLIEWIAPEHRRAFGQLHHEVMQGKAGVLEFELIGAKGTRRWLDTHAAPMCDENNNVHALLAVTRDITARKCTEEALREKDQLLRQVIDLVPVFIFAKDHQGRFLFANHAAAESTGMSPQQIVGLCDRDFVRDRDQAETFMRDDLDVISSGKPKFVAEESLVDASGRLRILQTTKIPFTSPGTGEKALLGVSVDITESRKIAQWISCQNRVLELIATGRPLPEILDALARSVETQATDMLVSILLLDHDEVHLRHGAAPSLPEAYTRAIDGMAIGDGAGSCGTAAWRRQTVIVEDVTIHPLWVNFRDLAAAHGLRACWSTPILDDERRVMGTFAVYYRTAARPNPEHTHLINQATQIAAIAIGHHRKEHALRESEQRFRELSENIQEVFWVSTVDKTQVLYVSRAYETIWGRSSLIHA